jgi:hypothetical protein
MDSGLCSGGADPRDSTRREVATLFLTPSASLMTAEKHDPRARGSHSISQTGPVGAGVAPALARSALRRPEAVRAGRAGTGSIRSSADRATGFADPFAVSTAGGRDGCRARGRRGGPAVAGGGEAVDPRGGSSCWEPVGGRADGCRGRCDAGVGTTAGGGAVGWGATSSVRASAPDGPAAGRGGVGGEASRGGAGCAADSGGEGVDADPGLAAGLGGEGVEADAGGAAARGGEGVGCAAGLGGEGIGGAAARGGEGVGCAAGLGGEGIGGAAARGGEGVGCAAGLVERAAGAPRGRENVVLGDGGAAAGRAAALRAASRDAARSRAVEGSGSVDAAVNAVDPD